MRKGNTPAKVTTITKGEGVWSRVFHWKYQRPTLPFIVLTLCFFLVALQSLTPYLPIRPFADDSRPDTCTNCFPYTYKNNIQPRDTCRQNEHIKLVMLITTVPTERDRRDVIRATWCNFSSRGIQGVRCIFLFGSGYGLGPQRALEKEAREFNDILQDDYHDTYYNLSIKVIMGYRWLMHVCPQAEFVIRTAGDNYVNVPQVLELLRSKGEQVSRYMVGDCHSGVMVWRWPFHRWVVSFKEYPYLLYPPYCKGTTFMTSFHVMTEIVNVSSNVPFFPIEDVYFGMCMQQFKNKYRLASAHGFSAPLLTWSDIFALGSREKCAFGDPWFSVHDVEPADILRIHEECKGVPVKRVPRLSMDGEEDLKMNQFYILEFS